MFRRGSATEQHQLGEKDKNIQAQLRHASPDITRRVYMQTVPERQLEAAERLELAAKGKPTRRADESVQMSVQTLPSLPLNEGPKATHKLLILFSHALL
jgi:hypothetical protein